MRPEAVSRQIMMRARCQGEESRADSSCSDGIVRTRATAENVRTATSADRWHGSQACTFCAPCHGHMCASGEPLGAAATRRFGRRVRTCAFGPESSYVNTCFISLASWDISASRFPGVSGVWDLHALLLLLASWAHGRVWGAAGRGCHMPAWPGSAHFMRSYYHDVYRALFGITKLSGAGRGWPRLLLLVVKRPASTAHLASSASGCPWPGRRDWALGAAAERCASTIFEGHHWQHAPKEGPLSKDSRLRSEVEWHRLNENETSEVAVDYRPRSRTMMEGYLPPMHGPGNRAEDAPRISSTRSMGREWAAGAFLGRPVYVHERHAERQVCKGG
jgi:hypothetical protein